MLKTIKITNGMSNDFLIIKTNATIEQIETMCNFINKESENGRGFIGENYTKQLRNEIYFDTLYDSELDMPDKKDEIEKVIIDEYFDLSKLYAQQSER